MWSLHLTSSGDDDLRCWSSSPVLALQINLLNAHGLLKYGSTLLLVAQLLTHHWLHRKGQGVLLLMLIHPHKASAAQEARMAFYCAVGTRCVHHVH